MRVYAIALVTTSTAILTHNASSSGTRISRETQVDSSAISRSPDGSHDDVPAKQLLRAGEITAGEERVFHSVDALITRAMSALLGAFHRSDASLKGLPLSEQVSRKASDRVALEYLLAKMQVEPWELLATIKKEKIKARDGQSDLVRAAQVPSNELSNKLMEQGALHPEDVIKKVLTAAKVNSFKSKDRWHVQNPAGPNLEDLKDYLIKTNPDNGTPLDMLELLTRYFNSAADLATFFANANLDRKNKKILVEIQDAFFKLWILDEVSIGDAIKRLGMSSNVEAIEEASVALTTYSRKEMFVANKCLDTLIGYIGVYTDTHSGSLPAVVQVLSELLGNCQASMLITKSANIGDAKMMALESEMYRHWKKEGLTPDELRAEFNEEDRIRPSGYKDHWKFFETYDRLWRQQQKSRHLRTLS